MRATICVAFPVRSAIASIDDDDMMIATVPNRAHLLLAAQNRQCQSICKHEKILNQQQMLQW
jgi:hypothetical protein